MRRWYLLHIMLYSVGVGRLCVSLKITGVCMNRDEIATLRRRAAMYIGSVITAKAKSTTSSTGIFALL